MQDRLHHSLLLAAGPLRQATLSNHTTADLTEALSRRDAGQQPPRQVPLLFRPVSGGNKELDKTLTFPGRGSSAASRRPSARCGDPSTETAHSAAGRWSGSCAKQSCRGGQSHPQGCARFPASETRRGETSFKKRTGPFLTSRLNIQNTDGIGSTQHFQAKANHLPCVRTGRRRMRACHQ